MPPPPPSLPPRTLYGRTRKGRRQGRTKRKGATCQTMYLGSIYVSVSMFPRRHHENVSAGTTQRRHLTHPPRASVGEKSLDRSQLRLDFVSNSYFNNKNKIIINNVTFNQISLANCNSPPMRTYPLHYSGLSPMAPRDVHTLVSSHPIFEWHTLKDC